jgi:glucose-1-phosphate thymidylyltransferase
VALSYASQNEPKGLADALIVGESFLNGHKCALILGDNLFYGPGLGTQLQRHREIEGALIFAYQVAEPHRYGVVELDDAGRVISLEEKPADPKSNYAVPGIYFYDEQASRIARGLVPSSRGELEITDLNRTYLDRGQLRAEVLQRTTTWLDAGTHESLFEAAGLIRTLQHRSGLRIGDIDDIARGHGWLEDQPPE